MEVKALIFVILCAALCFVSSCEEKRDAVYISAGADAYQMQESVFAMSGDPYKTPPTAAAAPAAGNVLPAVPDNPEMSTPDGHTPLPPAKPQTSAVQSPDNNLIKSSPDTNITVLSLTEQVKRNETAKLYVQGSPDLLYNIAVHYKSGISTAKGLEEKCADSTGAVGWEWKVGGKTTFGKYKIVVSGGDQSLVVHFEVIAEG